ncbi:putative photosystem I [Helianthus annuus]|nr:putative photosystem I [Helianthus annuus]
MRVIQTYDGCLANWYICCYRPTERIGLARASLGVITSLVAQYMYSLPAYAFIAQDFTTQAALYTHHHYIVGFIMTGVIAHGGIFFIRDYNPEQNEDNVLSRMLEHKETIISHLRWDSRTNYYT